MKNKSWKLTHSFPMQPFSTPWKHQRVNKRFFGNKWVKNTIWKLIAQVRNQ